MFGPVKQRGLCFIYKDVCMDLRTELVPEKGHGLDIVFYSLCPVESSPFLIDLPGLG